MKNNAFELLDFCSVVAAGGIEGSIIPSYLKGIKRHPTYPIDLRLLCRRCDAWEYSHSKNSEPSTAPGRPGMVKRRG
jgi:hypothetical protein